MPPPPTAAVRGSDRHHQDTEQHRRPGRHWHRLKGPQRRHQSVYRRPNVTSGGHTLTTGGGDGGGGSGGGGDARAVGQVSPADRSARRTRSARVSPPNQQRSSRRASSAPDASECFSGISGHTRQFLFRGIGIYDRSLHCGLEVVWPNAYRSHYENQSLM